MTTPCDHIRQTGLPCATPQCADGPEGGVPSGNLQLSPGGLRWTRQLVPFDYGPSFWQWIPRDENAKKVF